MATLNGWQRLWVVFTGLWLGVYGVAGIDVSVPFYVYLAMAVVPPVLLYVAGFNSTRLSAGAVCRGSSPTATALRPQ